jgi:UDP-N-acetylglucosamine enolpyruvyl transferase
MDKLVIKGGRQLSGTVAVSGSKNAALALMAASLLPASGKTVISRVPTCAMFTRFQTYCASLAHEWNLKKTR